MVLKVPLPKVICAACEAFLTTRSGSSGRPRRDWGRQGCGAPGGARMIHTRCVVPVPLRGVAVLGMERR